MTTVYILISGLFIKVSEINPAFNTLSSEIKMQSKDMQFSLGTTVTKIFKR